jgi:competence protein ComEC
LLLQAAAWLFQLLWPLLRWLEQQVPVLQLSLDGWPLLLAALGLVWLLLPRGWPLRAMGLLLCLPVLLLRPATPPDGEAWFTLLDVGQGQAAVIQTRHHALVMDTGPRFPSGFDTGSAVLLPYLQSRGIHRVDRLIISHSDIDHLGGAASLLEAMPVAGIFSGEARRMGWVEFEPCQRGLEWEWDGVHFRFLHPVRPLAEREGNDDACVLRVSSGGQVLLIGSDIEAAAEQDLLASGEPLRADVLVAPHHGSLTSSTLPFVEAVSPTWVLYSAGYRNRYGHPREEVMARYQGVGARQYISWQEGAMQMRLGAEEGITLQAYRSQARRYWHSSR